ncbi:MAG: purine-nucleoside phosphorylase [Nonlabens sp.]
MLTHRQLDKSIEYLRAQGFDAPEIGIVLGTGLGRLVEHIEDSKTVHYNNIPSFPLATVEFHSGKLIYGTMAGKKVVVMQGRFHLYEGYDFIDITYPIRVMKGLGVKNLLISNAAGAIDLAMKKGDMMLIEDHINLQGGSPLAFKGVSDFGERFTDMSAPYSKRINDAMMDTASALGMNLHSGVYASVVGPQLETRAEYRMLKILGADAVGMSTVPEVIVANHLDLPVAAVSVLTDECDPDHLEPVNVPEIIEIAGKAEPKMVQLFQGVIERL